RRRARLLLTLLGYTEGCGDTVGKRAPRFNQASVAHHVASFVDAAGMVTLEGAPKKPAKQDHIVGVFFKILNDLHRTHIKRSLDQAPRVDIENEPERGAARDQLNLATHRVGGH